MKKLLMSVFMCVFGGIGYANATCSSGQVELPNGSCVNGKFAVTTTSGQTSLSWTMTAVGEFTADCGDGGTLTSSASDVSGTTITRSGTTEATYTCTWGSAGVHTVVFDGTATNYETYDTNDEDANKAAISFYVNNSTTNSVKIASISGDLSSMFPYMSANAVNGAQPRFMYTFFRASNLTSIPGTLFSAYTNLARRMFFYTFSECTGLTSIPGGLFNNITLCDGGFGFGHIFKNCTGLTQIPSNLFGCIGTIGGSTFNRTFYECTGLTSIPAGLFSGVTGGIGHAFNSTFAHCTGLTSIPSTLFSSIRTGVYDMFKSTFFGCTNLSGYIPPALFSGLVANSSPDYTEFMLDIFDNTNLDTTCPSGMTQYITGYESYWDGHVSCVDENLTCSAGEYFVAHDYKCTQCPANSYCPGGTYAYSENQTQGITACPTGHYSATGASQCTPNTINITWQREDGTTLTTNSCTYGNAIIIPEAPHKSGYKFTGWTVVQ